MFSSEDLRRLFRALPPDTVPTQVLPSLIFSSSGTGLVSSQHIHTEFRRRVTQDLQRTTVTKLAAELDISREVVVQLVRASPDLALLSRDESNLINRLERSRIEERLSDLLCSQLISKSSLSREMDVSAKSIDSLIHEYHRNEFFEGNDCLFSGTYCQKLKNIIIDSLTQSYEDARPIDISSNSLPGSPPTWLTKQILEPLLEETGLRSRFRLITSPNNIHFVPTSFVTRSRDEQAARLQAGHVACLSLYTFSEAFHELHPAIEDARKYFTTQSGVHISKYIAISTAWLSAFSNKCVQKLEREGCIGLKAMLDDEVPPQFQPIIMDQVRHETISYFERKHEAQFHEIEDLLLTKAKYEDSCVALLNFSRENAALQWQVLHQSAKSELRFHLADFISILPNKKKVLLAVAQEKTVQKRIEEQFWSHLSDLESQNEAQFSDFWVQRVTSRVHSYIEGAEAVKDKKLRDQLEELLAKYCQNELLPDTITKARLQSLTRSRKTHKNLQKLESSLDPENVALSRVIAGIAKFQKKQDIKDIDSAVSEATKRNLIDDMIRRMQRQKQSDGPLVFLTLIVILFARHHPGVVYCTGRFAPKLLKQLKTLLQEEDYEQLEKWKDAAKADSLSEEDRNGMRLMAEHY